MVKCPFCGFGNEDGALFCEQCKSDISGVAPAAPTAPTTPAAEAIPHAQAEAPVMAAVVEDVAMAEVIEVPSAEPVAEVVEIIEVVEPASAAAPPPPAFVPPPPPPPPQPQAPPAAAAAAIAPLPAGAEPKLVVVRGLKVNDVYNLFPGDNYIGRNDDKPVDIDLTFQEPEDKVWVSRQHALISFDDQKGTLTIEDLNSANGTWVNRVKIYPGQPQPLTGGSTIQIGTVHIRVKV